MAPWGPQAAKGPKGGMASKGSLGGHNMKLNILVWIMKDKKKNTYILLI